MKIVPALQPIINIETGSIWAYEALMRWFVHGTLKDPSQIEPCWVTTDMLMLEKLVEYATPMRKMTQRLFINVSHETLCSDRAYYAWRHKLVELLWAVSYPVTIEVIESVSDEVLAKRWPDLRSIGMALALDDYGDDFSQLERLMRYDWDYCKFDASKLCKEKNALATAYCNEKRIQMIAEKVENSQLMANACQCGLFEHQEFHFYQPEIITHIFDIKVTVC